MDNNQELFKVFLTMHNKKAKTTKEILKSGQMRMFRLQANHLKKRVNLKRW